MAGVLIFDGMAVKTSIVYMESFKKSLKLILYLSAEKVILGPVQTPLLHMSRIEFNELSSCEVRRLNQFETADIIWIGSAVLHAWLSRE